MLMSGLCIFNAHPALYWGQSSYSAPPRWLEIGARDGANGQPFGYTRLFGHEFNTTGVLGVSYGAGEAYMQGFPSWITVPSHQWLSMARSWHFFFAWVFLINGLCYVAYTVWSRHLARDLWPTGADIRRIGRSIVDHLRFRHPAGEEAKRYNVLQKLAYLTVDFHSAAADHPDGPRPVAAARYAVRGWVGLVGGRQSARSIHFIVAWALVAFVLIHVFEVIVTGLWNNLRSMITGRYRVPEEIAHE